MGMMKYLAPAIFASFFAIAPASAMPASSTTGLDRADASSIVHVQITAMDIIIAGRAVRSIGPVAVTRRLHAAITAMVHVRTIGVPGAA